MGYKGWPNIIFHRSYMIYEVPGIRVLVMEYRKLRFVIELLSRPWHLVPTVQVVQGFVDSTSAY